MRSLLALAACLLFAGCTSSPPEDAAMATAGPPPFAGSTEEWDAATWGHVCVEVAAGCLGQHTWDVDGKVVDIPSGATAAHLVVTWAAPDPRYDELRVWATVGDQDPLVVTGTSPLAIAFDQLPAGTTIEVTAAVAGIEDMAVKAHDMQRYHGTLTFA